MVLLETWCAWLSSVPTTIIVTMFIVSVLKVTCAMKKASAASYTNPDNITTKKANMWFMHVGVVCLFAFWIRSTIQSIVFTVLIAEDRHEEKVGTSLQVGWLFYGIGLWLMMASFVLRIQFTFKGTHLEYSPVVIKVLYALLIIALVEVILIGVLEYEYSLIMAYVGIASHFLFCCLLIYLLFSKIFNIMQHRLRERTSVAVSGQSQEMATINNEKDDDENEVSSPRSLNQISLDSINAVTRYAMLMYVGIISTYVVSILIFIDIEYEWSLSPSILTWGATLVGFDLLVNATSIFLLFDYNSVHYYRVCKLCHIACERCCVELIYAYSKKNGKDRAEFTNLILSGGDDDVGAVL